MTVEGGTLNSLWRVAQNANIPEDIQTTAAREAIKLQNTPPGTSREQAEAAAQTRLAGIHQQLEKLQGPTGRVCVDAAKAGTTVSTSPAAIHARLAAAEPAGLEQLKSLVTNMVHDVDRLEELGSWVGVHIANRLTDERERRNIRATLASPGAISWPFERKIEAFFEAIAEGEHIDTVTTFMQELNAVHDALQTAVGGDREKLVAIATKWAQETGLQGPWYGSAGPNASLDDLTRHVVVANLSSGKGHQAIYEAIACAA